MSNLFHPMTTAPIGCLDEREAFEAWATLNGWNRTHLSRSRVNNTYAWRGLNEAWDAFKAGRASVSASRQEGWQPIETAPVGRVMFVVAAFNAPLRRGGIYTTDPYCVWQEKRGQFQRWPHGALSPTHWQSLAAAPHQAQEAQGDRHGN